MISRLRREDEPTLAVLGRSASDLTAVERILIGVGDPPDERSDLARCVRDAGLHPHFVAARVRAVLPNKAT